MNQIYIGLELESRWTQISYFTAGMDEPKTITTTSGAWKKDYIRKVFQTVPILTDYEQIAKVTIHLEPIDVNVVLQAVECITVLGVAREKIHFVDTKESFYHFAMSQSQELISHDVVLFHCQDADFEGYYLKKDRNQKVFVHKVVQGTLPEDAQEKDAEFAQCADTILKGKVVSAIYLVGSGFQGKWLNEALMVLCKGRRVFQGDDLFAKGACYSFQEKNTTFDSEYVLQHDVLLQIKEGNRTYFETFLEAGGRCYEVSKSCQVLLNDQMSVDLWLQKPGDKLAKIESLELTDIPQRPPKATRIEIEAFPGNRRQIMIRLKDMGLGNLYPASGKIWEYCIDE